MIGKILAFLVAIGMGSNEESFSCVVASKSLKIKWIVGLTSIAVLFGAMFFGQLVSETFNELTNITPTKSFMVAVLLSIGLWFAIANVFKLPISTTTSVVGALSGAALMLGGDINLGIIRSIILSWFFSPIIGLLFAYFFDKFIQFLIFKNTHNFRQREIIERISSRLLLLITLILVFFRGANDVANAVFFFVPADPFKFKMLGAIGMSLGSLFFSGRLIKEVGTKLTELNPSASLSTQISSMLVVSLFTFLKMPISGSTVFVSGLIGSGLARNKKVNTNTFYNMFFSWIITLPMCALFSAIFVSFF